ncbi:hypothetical protein SAMN05216574_101443 [Blastococcus tunisiensis]|uniref:Uncharacterized protein n=1 Tax=Blastococcus tunisiensis TaxID=1798228 RepID=A0A1I1WLM6_9ACTN|nr:hypothetical protein SAMN05216574_101443 [Blastococcus sp. DSM 46838]
MSCHPFPRPVRHRALLRGRERRRGTTGPRLLPQRSARRAEGSWSGREETAREAPTLSCRTGRGTSKDSPPQAVVNDGEAGATRSVARRVLRTRPTGRSATTMSARSPVREPRSTATSRTPLAARSRPGRARRVPSAVSSAMSRAWPGQRPPEDVRPDVADRRVCPQGPNCAQAPRCSRPASAGCRTTGGTPVSRETPVILQVRRHTGTPTVVGLPENVLQRAGGARRRRPGTASRRTPGLGRRRTGAVPGDRLPGRGRTPAAGLGPSTGGLGAAPRRRQMKGPWQVTPGAAATGEQPETVRESWL